MGEPTQKKKPKLRVDASNVPIGRRPADDDYYTSELEYLGKDPVSGKDYVTNKVGKTLPPSLPKPPEPVEEGTKTRAQMAAETNNHGLKKVAKANAMKKRYANSK